MDERAGYLTGCLSKICPAEHLEQELGDILSHYPGSLTSPLLLTKTKCRLETHITYLVYPGVVLKEYGRHSFHRIGES